MKKIIFAVAVLLVCATIFVVVPNLYVRASETYKNDYLSQGNQKMETLNRHIVISEENMQYALQIANSAIKDFEKAESWGHIGNEKEDAQDKVAFYKDILKKISSNDTEYHIIGYDDLDGGVF